MTANPNDAHTVLALLSLPPVRNQLAPGSTFTLISQNVDGLSERALSDISATFEASGVDIKPTPGEQPRLLEMHGRLFEVTCTSRQCRYSELNFDSPVAKALQGTEDLVDAGEMEPDLPVEDLPHCKKCGALARPGVVWFEETPKHLKTINKLVDEADLCLVIGTSSTVSKSG